jgi:hypothetical protein
MKDLLKNTHDKAEEVQGNKLVVVLVAIFAVFLLIGFVANYAIKTLLNNSETQQITDNQNSTADLVEYAGIINFIDPRNFPEDEISYHLTQVGGKRIILLTAKDSKLEVSEGLYATVTGYLIKASDGSTDILMVETVSISNR